MKSRAIEEWAHYRENTLKYFRINKRTAALGLLFGVGVPYGIYHLTHGELESRDRKARERI